MVLNKELGIMNYEERTKRKRAALFFVCIPDSLFIIPDSITFSYRLVGKRFDWRDWPTLAEDQNELTNPANLVIE